MDESVLSWNIPNLITIWLMVSVLVVVLFFAKKAVTAWNS
jgi:hypothetical protein